MSHVRLVAGRELTETFRSKAYWVMVAVTAVAVTAIIVLPKILDDGTSYELGLGPGEPRGLQDDLGALATAFDVDLELADVDDDRGAAEAAVHDGDLDAALLFEDDGSALVRLEHTDETLVALASQGAIAATARQQLVESGLDEVQARQALSTPPPAEVVVDDDESGRSAVAYFVSLLLYFALFMGGMGIATGIAVEKSTRIAEVLVTSVPPSRLLAGKMIGTGVSTLLLLLVAAVPFLVAVPLGAVDVPAAAVGDVVGGFGWFLLGYAIYATGFAALGALVDRQEDLGGAVGPFSTALILAFFAAIQAQTAPASTLAQVTSYFPLSAPMVMPVRVAEGAVGPIEVAIAVVLCLVTFFVLLRVGGTIYRRALLRGGGQRLKLTEVLRG